jgi:diaminopimelate decarboxylase
MSTIDTERRQRTRPLYDSEITALADRHGTPLYVYDLIQLRQRIAQLRLAMRDANVTLFFATMANDRLPVLKLMAGLGLGACVNSTSHLALASECGFLDRQIQFTSTGVAEDDMRLLQRRGIRCNLDSISQLNAWLKLGAQEVGIRVNASSIGRGLPKDRIGIEASQVTETAAIAAKNGSTLSGLHIYVGTNFQQPVEMLPTLERFFDLAASVKSLSYVNIGGGIGVNYRHDGPEFDIFEFGNGISEFARRLRQRLDHDVQVIVEPGRGLAAGCGTFVTTVTDVKNLAGQRYAAVDASIAIFPRPFHHPDSPHHVRQLGNAELQVRDSAGEKMTIVGRTTFSRDILGSIQPMSTINIGDLFAFADAGAYSQSMASRFLGQCDPEMVFVDN